MIKMLIKGLFKNWSLLRALRLILGVTFIMNGITGQFWFMVLIGGFFLYQVIVNAGCGTVNPADRLYKDKPFEIQEVEFEEMKPKSDTISS